ncbi:MAG TPA: PQQ-binding-like beta-propeller repeat protein [Rhizomicrobium sp.]|nr:PQQ-binding-like beta-propeller repeat protein [Rhizomicrobium sp.]
MRSINRRMMLAGSSAAALLWHVPSFAQSATAPRDTDWLHYANDLSSTRYSPLDQISAANFNQLQLAWRFSTNSFGPRLDADYQSTPLVVKGRIYVTAGFRRDVVCLDAGTGEILWMHTHDEGARIGSRGGPGLGVGYWTDGSAERIVYVTRGYTMFSLDAKTGIPDPAFGTNGSVDLRLNDDQTMDPDKGIIGLHAPPLVVKNTIVVGAAPTLASKGFVRGFDVKTGQRKWIFHTIPQKGEFGYETWTTPGQAEASGNTGAWAPMSADVELGLVFVPVELPQTDMLGASRTGPNLFAESLVALDIETGTRKWHYQMIHHGLWDRDVSCAGVICDIPHDGKIIKAIAQPTKQGYVYVLDRTTGKPVWPIPEKKVAKGNVPGEWYSPTQPIPSAPPPFAKQGVTENDLVDFTPQIKARALEIASHYKLAGLYDPPPLVNDKIFGALNLPGLQGGINWPGASYDPETHLLYLFAKNQFEVTGVVQGPDGKVFQRGGQPAAGSADANGGAFGGVASLTGPAGRQRGSIGRDGLTDPIVPGMISIEGIPLMKPPYGTITCIDLSKGTRVWQIVHGETPDAIKNHPLLKGVTIPRTGQSGILGTLTTKTLVICGDCGLFTDERGRKGARLRAYDKATGEQKGAVFMDKVQTGATMTYMHQGKQYLVCAQGGSYGADLVAYCLPGEASAAPAREER